MTYRPAEPNVPIRPGDVIQLAEGDDRYGPGGVLRVTRVRPDISKWYGGEWVWIEGIPIGRETDGQPRSILARISALWRMSA
jgi:hypothetical protein